MRDHALVFNASNALRCAGRVDLIRYLTVLPIFIRNIVRVGDLLHLGSVIKSLLCHLVTWAIPVSDAIDLTIRTKRPKITHKITTAQIS